MMNKFVMVFGLPRTGTTWAFNVAREMLKGKDFNSGFVSRPSVNWVEDPQIVLLKTHTPWRLDELGNLLESGAGRMIMSVRNPGDTVLSQMRVIRSQGRKPKRMELLEQLASNYERYLRAFSDYPQYLVVDEAEINSKTLEICQSINSYCEFESRSLKKIAESFTKSSVSEKIKGIAVEQGWQGTFDEFDKETHWHANHLHNKEYVVEWSPAEHQLIAQIDKMIDKFKNNNNVRERTWSPNAHNLISSYISA
jgi:hypothetical protein